MPLQRLKTRAQFQAVMREGATVSRTAHFVLHRLSLPVDLKPDSLAEASDRAPVCPLFPRHAEQQAWIGAMAPKRWARRAVTRNTVKRQIYTLSEQFKPRLCGAAHVVRLRAAFGREQFVSATSDVLKAALRVELLQLLNRLAGCDSRGTTLLMQRLLSTVVRGYRLLLSPMLGSACRFEPTCSVYAPGSAGATWPQAAAAI